MLLCLKRRETFHDQFRKTEDGKFSSVTQTKKVSMVVPTVFHLKGRSSLKEVGSKYWTHENQNSLFERDKTRDFLL